MEPISGISGLHGEHIQLKSSHPLPRSFSKSFLCPTVYHRDVTETLSDLITAEDEKLFAFLVTNKMKYCVKEVKRLF